MKLTPDIASLTEHQRKKRIEAFREEADPLFMKWHAGEATQEAWLAKREEIRARYPYPEGQG